MARRILAGDRLRINVAEDPDLSKVYPVAGDGTLDFSYVGRVLVADRTADQVADRIEELLERDYFKQATVSVSVERFVEGDLFLIGAVAQPGTIQFSGDTILTLIEAITMRGGLLPNANGSEVQILRWKPGGSMARESTVVDVQSMLDNRDFSNDQFLRPRDMIIVPALGEGEGADEFLALGEVSRPGFHAYSEGMDMIRALSRIGGVSRDAQLESASILRPSTGGDYRSISVDLARLLGAADMTQNVPVMAGDIIYVPSSVHALSGRVYLLGEVANVGAVSLPSDRDATLAKTILRAGGFTKFANTGKVRITRAGPDGVEQELIVDVGRILKSGSFGDDVPLKDGDVVVVPERLLF